MAPVQKPSALIEIIPGGPSAEDIRERVLGYGRAGIGKTRWGLSLPERYGKIAYYAADKNSHLLQSISRAKRSRIVVVKPKGDDPTASFMRFCMTDWKKIDPEIRTIVVDTYSKVAMDAVAFSANTGAVDREKHYIVGVPGEGGVAIPNRGDYQAVDALSKNFLDMIFDKQEDMHIVFLMHEDSKLIGGTHLIGGPSHPGWSMMDYLPSQFSTVVRLIRDQQLVKGASEPVDVVVAVGTNDGKFIAKIREEETSPKGLARFTCNNDPINWWNTYDASVLAGKETQ